LVAGQSGRHTAGRFIRSACARNAKFHWLAFYGMDADNLEDRKAFLVRAERVAKEFFIR
jgi:hypothetical protein